MHSLAHLAPNYLLLRNFLFVIFYSTEIFVLIKIIQKKLQIES